MVLPPESDHSLGESNKAHKNPLSSAIEVETFAGKVHVEWDPTAAVTPIGQLPFFIEFLKLGHRFKPWVEDCPLHYISNNAPKKVDEGGYNIDTWFVSHTIAPQPCTNSSSSHDGIGTSNTGDNLYANKTGLSPNTRYYYRLCGKGTNNQVSDGGVTSFIFNITLTPMTVQTMDVTEIDVNTVKLWGRIISGSDIDTWWATGTSSNITCNNSQRIGAHSDNGDTGETRSYTWAPLNSNTTYYYRFCGHGADRTHSGVVKSFTTFIRCGDGLKANGGTEGYSGVYNIGSILISNTVKVLFEPYTIPDRLVISNYHTGTIYADSGFVSGTQNGSFKALDHRGKVQVDVYGNANPATAWYILMSCAGGTLPDLKSADVLKEIAPEE